MTTNQFRFEYHPGTLRFGDNIVSKLSDELDRLGLENALVVSGKTVGTTPDIVRPVKEGLGDKLAGVFAETTPGKRVGTAHRGVQKMRELDADCIVALGGGSSLDTAKMMRVLSTSGESLEDATRQIVENGTVDIPDGELTPMIAIPTTLAGADLSIVAGTRAGPKGGIVDQTHSGGIGDARLMPEVIFYDPELFATTPKPILAGSAMNGFDKGIESLYANCATPVTDATAMRGLQLLSDSLIEFGNADNVTPENLAPVVKGIMLVQYGIAQPHQTTMALIHAFGHGLTRNYDVQQGSAHAILAPPALEYIFDEVDGRRGLIAAGLGVEEKGPDLAGAIVEKFKDIREALELPSRLRDIDGPTRDEFPTVIETVMTDAFMANNPEDLNPTEADIEGVLEKAY